MVSACFESAPGMPIAPSEIGDRMLRFPLKPPIMASTPQISITVPIPLQRSASPEGFLPVSRIAPRNIPVTIRRIDHKSRTGTDGITPKR